MTGVPPEVVERLRAAGCVFAEDEAPLLGEAARSPADLEALVGRRVAGEPLEQLLGWAEFCGLRVALRPGVFVPRRRTALMVREAIAHLAAGEVLVDLCCGSGAVAAAVAAAVPGVEVYAADVDPAAVGCARENLSGVGVVLRGDLFAPLPSDLAGRVRVLTANVPYVPSSAVAGMPPEARDHEPRSALDGGPDGLDVLRRVAGGAPYWLAPGGLLLTETATRQASAAVAVIAGAGLAPRVVTDGELGATVVAGTR